jgi:hypothetical protein
LVKFGDTKVVEHDEFKITVGTASAGMAMERDLAIDDVDDWLKSKGYTRQEVVLDTVDKRTSRWFFVLAAVRPPCMGALKDFSYQGEKVDPPNIAAFMDLPEALVQLWYAAAIGLNPHWIPSQERPEEEKKSAETKTGSSKKHSPT